MSWLSKLAFWRDDEPEITEPSQPGIEHMDGYEVNGCFVPNEEEPDSQALSDAVLEDSPDPFLS